MELDFKKSFVANQSVGNDVSIGNIKQQSVKDDNNSFESKLDSIRQNSKKEDSRAADNRDADSKKRTNSAKPDEARRGDDKNRTRDVNGINNKLDAENNTVKTEQDNAEATTVIEQTKTDETEGMKKTEAQNNAGVTSVAEPEPVLTEEQNQELIKMLAEIAGVTTEQAEAALEKLGLTPEQLNTPENINKFLIEAMELKEPAELLKVDNLPGIHEGINNAVKEAVKSAAEMAVNVPEANAQAVDAPVIAESAAEQSAQVNTDILSQNTQNENIHKQTENTDKSNKTEGETAQSPISKDELPVNNEVTGAYNPDANLSDNKQNQSGGKSKEGEQNANAGTVSGEGAALTESQPAHAQNTPGNTTEQSQTPVIIQQGNETIVEVGGRAVSRTTQPQTTGEAANIINQIAEKMKIDFKPNVTEIKINLRPEDLGNVTVKILAASGIITAEIVTENSKVKELVEQNLNTLKETLKEQGVDVGELSVSVGQQENEERMRQFIRERERSKGRMSQIISRIAEEETEAGEVNYVTEAEISGSTVNYSV